MSEGLKKYGIVETDNKLMFFYWREVSPLCGAHIFVFAKSALASHLARVSANVIEN